LGVKLERDTHRLARADVIAQAIFDNAPDGVLVVDKSGRMTAVNAELQRMTGYDLDELVEQPVEMLVPEDQRAVHRRHRRNYAAQPTRRAMGAGRQLTLLRKDGTTIPVDISLSSMAAVDPYAQSDVVVMIRDQSERSDTETRLAEAQRIAHIGTWSWEVGSEEVLWSAELRRIYGLDAADGPMSNPEFALLVHPEDNDRVNAAMLNTVRNLTPFDHEYRIIRPDGSVRWLHANGDVAELRNGRAFRLVGYCRDITEQRDAEARRNQAMQDLRDYQAILERVARDEDLPATLDILCREVENRLPGVACSILLVDETNRTLYHGAAPTLPEEFLQAIDGLPIVRGLGACGTAAATGETVIVEDVLDSSLTVAFVDLADKHGLRSVWSLPLKSATGTVLATFAVYRSEPHRPGAEEVAALVAAGDLAALAIERKLAEQALTLAAQVDPLTSLPNRARFLDELAQRLQSDRAPTGVMFVDLDRFKWINDSMGHAVGDRVLVEAAERIRASLPKNCFVSRFGGDEFTIILPNASPARIARVARDLERAFDNPFTVDGGEFFLTVSVGVRTNDRHADASEMVRDADAAMYAAKERGRARHIVFDERLRQRAVERLSIESKLRRGIERDEFVMYYQPVVDLTSGRWAGVEALARWVHPADGLMAPLDFIPLAEETGLIVPLGQRLFEKLLIDLDGLHGGCHWPVSVNLSPIQLSDPSLTKWMQAAISAHGVAASSVILELTETSLMEDFDRARPMLEELVAAGFSLVIDDFGTGHSSIARLIEMPVHGIKIDRSFIVRLGDDPAAERVVAAVIDLAHAIDMRVVSEGVETEGALARLRALRCDFAQGYLMSRPVPAADLERVLEQRPVA
jgi:c-di-GMP-specific phosphodiesterase